MDNHIVSAIVVLGTALTYLFGSHPDPAAFWEPYSLVAGLLLFLVIGGMVAIVSLTTPHKDSFEPVVTRDKSDWPSEELSKRKGLQGSF